MSTNETLGPALIVNDDGVDLGGVAVTLLLEWRRWLLWSLPLFLLGACFIYTLTPLYEAGALFLPQSKERVSGAAAFFNTRSPGDVYLGLLGSRTVLDAVVDRAHLLDVYKTNSREVARNILRANSKFAAGEDTLVSIKIRNKNAQTAMTMANAYLDALQDFQENSSLHEASVRSKFFQQQLNQEADALTAAEQDLKAVEEQTGLIEPAQQTQIGLTTIVAVRAQITALQVELSGMLLSESDQNYQVKEVRSQIALLEAKERALESAASPGGASASVAKMPELNLDYARKLRAVKYHEALMTSLSSEYQTARLDENYGGAPFEVVDRAVVPEFRAWPPRTLLLCLDAVLSALFGLAVVVIALFWRRLMRDPLQAERLAMIRAGFRLRR